MNRKDRRAAQKQGKVGSPLAARSSLAPAATMFAAAVQAFRTGQRGEAERRCRDVLTVEPDHAGALHLLGMIAFQAGHRDAALELIGKAAAIDPHDVDCRFNLAQVLRALGRQNDAVIHLSQVTTLKRDHATAHWQLADIFLQQGRFDQAEIHYRRLLALKPDIAEACSNLGIALAGQSKWVEAAAHYRRALALNPNLLDVYRNLGRVLLIQGDTGEAVALARRALAISETEETKALFAQCIKNLPLPLFDDALRTLVVRALSEGWSRPSELSALSADLFKQNRAPAENGLGAIVGDRLLRALLETAPVHDIGLERELTTARLSLLEAAESSQTVQPDSLAFFSALARQCFLNEYVFACTGDEMQRVQRIQHSLCNDAASGAEVAAPGLIAVAAYAPLHALPCRDALLPRAWPEAIAPLIEQQVREPQEERKLRDTIAVLTSIDDEVSQKVRDQYEEMPYPRWLKTAPVGRPVTLEWYLLNQFPQAPFGAFATQGSLDVLIAGCGTGQHAIETGQRFTDAKVLAIDLSRASLGYALRKTREVGLQNIDYAQADILKLGTIGRRFDLIESSGVLHHLADPAQGWRVLLSLLKPSGFMHIGLYSAAARADIRAARTFIAEHGYGTSADDIRGCRQEILAYPDDTPLKNVAKYSDFFTTSECRDLLFHVQEHQLTIQEIAVFLRANDLRFIGFTGQPVQDYRQRFPDDKAATDLGRWHQFEIENPMAFVNMYQFWVQKL
jgi:tetratricopeptide (TPR) repeat protein/SAM-dependent methyltransferase